MDSAAPVLWEKYSAHRVSTLAQLRREARSEVAIVREVAKALRWLATEQPSDAVGPRHGLVTEGAFLLGSEIYRLGISVHTAVGRPALSLLYPQGSERSSIPAIPARFFVGVVTRVSRNHLLTEWENASGLHAALEVTVHATVLRAVTRMPRKPCLDELDLDCNAKCEACVRHLDRSSKFRLPDGWVA